MVLYTSTKYVHIQKMIACSQNQNMHQPIAVHGVVDICAKLWALNYKTKHIVLISRQKKSQTGGNTWRNMNERHSSQVEIEIWPGRPLFSNHCSGARSPIPSKASCRSLRRMQYILIRESKLVQRNIMKCTKSKAMYLPRKISSYEFKTSNYKYQTMAHGFVLSKKK